MFGNKSAWGWLYPYQGSKKCRALKGKSYVVGKDSSCDVVISKQLIPSNDDYANLSKQHFKIKRKDNEVFLKDLSSMHTYVNGKELYLNEKVKLKHNDVISVLRHHFKVFVFLDNKCLQADDYPEVIKNKYVVSYSLSEKKPDVTHVVFDKESCNRLVLKKLKGACVDETAEEIKKLRGLEHPCLLPIVDVYSTAEEVYIVTKHLEGGNLLSRIHPKKTLTDDDVKLVFYQTALAVQYLHDQEIAHGNLKPENILFFSSDSKSLVRVTDISLPRTNISASEPVNAESPLCVAPEFVSIRSGSKPHTTQADVWALGVILFYCLSGSPPFKHSMRTSSEWTCSFLPSVWSRRSLAKDLVKMILAPDPSERTRVERVLAHPWLKSDTIRSLAHSLMYPGEKYEPQEEEETPPSSPKQIFFEDIIIQRPKPPRNLTEKFGVQVLPIGPVSRKSTPEHIFRKNERQEEIENHTVQKSFSFRQPANVDNSFFRKSWSQRLPGSKPIPPKKPPRQISQDRLQTVPPTVSDKPTGLSSHPKTPPVPPAKPLRLFKQVPNVDISAESKVFRDNCHGENELSNGNCATPSQAGDSLCVGVASAEGHSVQMKQVSTGAFILPQTSKVTDNSDSGAQPSIPQPVPSPRTKILPTLEHSELKSVDSQDREECDAYSHIYEEIDSNFARGRSTKIKVSDETPSYESAVQSEVKITPTEALPHPPQKPERKSLMNQDTSTSSKPRKKRLAPQPPPKPRR